MIKTSTLRCILIGSQSRLIQCAELLLARGHKILTIVSDDPPVTSWAGEKGIRQIEPNDRLQCELARETFDLLLSIDNPHTVTTDIIRMAGGGYLLDSGDPNM